MNTPFTVFQPTGTLVPLVLDSPHSGIDYPEDFRAAELCQRGIESGLVKTVTLGGLETGIDVFYGRLEKML